MLESLSLYFPNLVAMTLGSVSLALLGAHLNSRGEVLQAMLISQSSSLGISSTLALSLFLHGQLLDKPLAPILGGILFSFFLYALAQFLCKKWRAKASSLLLGLFLIILALNYIVTVAFPALESHFARSFLGDIATTSKLSSWYYCGICLISLSGLLFFWKNFTLNSFWASSAERIFSKKYELIFYLIAGIMIIESTRIFGFLVSLSSLVILPLSLSLCVNNTWNYKMALVVTAFVSSFLGFALSLYFERLPTSAVIVLMQALMGILSILTYVLINRLNRKNSK
jgi:ABC-type Mn2+/Zn2+ transport system permease subunit